MVYVQEGRVRFFANFKFFSLCVCMDFLKVTGQAMGKDLLLFMFPFLDDYVRLPRKG